jgi:hypothetical protein
VIDSCSFIESIGPEPLTSDPTIGQSLIRFCSSPVRKCADNYRIEASVFAVNSTQPCSIETNYYLSLVRVVGSIKPPTTFGRRRQRGRIGVSV